MSNLYKSREYGIGNFLLPDRESIPTAAKKTKKYSKAVAQAIYSEFVQNRAWLSTSEYDNIARNRSYAQGRQDIYRYLEQYASARPQGERIISPTGVDSGRGQSSVARRNSYANIDYSVVSPAPRIRNKLISSIGRNIHRVSIDAIDSYSGAERESLKWGSYAEKIYGEKLKVLRGLAGLPEQQMGYVPGNVEELELFSAEGGFKLPYEAVMEDLVKHTLDISGWEENFKDRFVGDLVDNGFAIAKDVYDPVEGKVKVKYCDIQYSGVQYTKHDEYQNADYGYDYEKRKISDIRQYIGADKEHVLLGLAKKFKDFEGNRGTNDDWSDDDYNSYVNDNGYNYRYDNYTVPVLNVSWIDVEYDTEVAHTNKFDKTRTFKYEPGKKLGKRDKLIHTRRKVLYSCEWVIDTDIILSYGPAKHQARDGMAHPVLPYHCVKTPVQPIVEQIIPYLNEFMFNWINFQQRMSMSIPDGYTIDIGSISQLSLGKKKMDPLEVLKHWRRTGILFRKDTNVVGQVQLASAAVQRLEGGAGKILDDYLRAMDNAMYQIELITGISAVSLGASPSPKQGKAVTEYSIQSTNEILDNITRRMNMLKSFIAKGVCLRLQNIVRYDARAEKGYSGVVGKDRLYLLKIASGHERRYGIKTHATPDNNEKQALIETLAVELQNGRDGKPGIGSAAYTRFVSMIQNGVSLKRISMMLEHEVRKATELADERAAAAQQRDAENAVMLKREEVQAERERSQIKTKETIAIDTNKAMLDAGIESVKQNQMTYEEFIGRLTGGPQAQQAPMGQLGGAESAQAADALLQEGLGQPGASPEDTTEGLTPAEGEV